MVRKVKNFPTRWAVFFFSIMFYFMISSFMNDTSSTEVSDEIQDDFPDISVWHWGHMPITYEINQGYCNPVQINQMRRGLDIVSNMTEGLVTFEESSGNVDLNIECFVRSVLVEELRENATCVVKTYSYRRDLIDPTFSDVVNESVHTISITNLGSFENNYTWEICYIPLDFSVLGEGSPSLIQGNVILKGESNLYQDGTGYTTCSFPAKEIHEILHVLGFAHYPYEIPLEYDYSYWSYADDIMFPYLDCAVQKTLNQKYVSCLKYIYSDGGVGFCNDVNFIPESYFTPVTE